MALCVTCIFAPAWAANVAARAVGKIHVSRNAINTILQQSLLACGSAPPPGEGVCRLAPHGHAA